MNRMSLRDQLPRDLSRGLKVNEVTGALAQHGKVQGFKNSGAIVGLKPARTTLRNIIRWDCYYYVSNYFLTVRSGGPGFPFVSKSTN